MITRSTTPFDDEMPQVCLQSLSRTYPPGHHATILVSVVLRIWMKGKGLLRYTSYCKLHELHNNTSLFEVRHPTQGRKTSFQVTICDLFVLPPRNPRQFASNPLSPLPTRLCSTDSLHCPTSPSDPVSSSFVPSADSTLH